MFVFPIVGRGDEDGLMKEKVGKISALYGEYEYRADKTVGLNFKGILNCALLISEFGDAT